MDSTKSIRNDRTLHFLIAIFVFMSIAIMAMGIIIYFTQKANIEATWEEQLTGILNLKTAQIENWKNERINGINSLATDPSFRNDANILLSHSADKAVKKRIMELFHNICEVNYFGVSLIDTEFHDALSFNVSGSYIQAYETDHLRRVRAEKKTVISDIHDHPGENKPHFDLIAPLITGSRVFGYLLLRVDAGIYTSSMITSWPIHSQSAEILFAERQGDKVLYINQPRHSNNKGSRLQASMADTNILAVKGLSGFEGVTKGYDYRGVPVIGAVRKISSSNWVVVVKVDRAEIYGAIFSRALVIFFFILLVIGVCALATTLFWKNQKMLQTKELAHFQKQKLLAEERLSESEFKFGALFNSMNEGVALHKLLYDAQGQAIDYEIQDINPAYERHTGISAQEAKGKRASELYKSGNPPYFDIYTAVATTGVSQELETYFEPLDRYFVISVTSPSPGYFATIFTDISDRKRNEEELLKRQERLNLLYILSHMESDDENAVIELALNSALTTSESESGYIAFIENGNICFDKMSWAGKAGGSDKLMKQYRNLLETDEFLTRSWKTGKRIIENDHVIENPLNTELPITRSVQIVIKENGKVLVLAGMFNKKTHYIIDDARHFELFLTEMWNIIQKKRSAKELLDSQNRFKTLANATYEGITIIENGEIIDINQQLTAMTGYSSEELLHRKVIDFVAPHSVEKFREIIQTDLSQSYEYDIVKRDGSMLSIEVRTRKYQVGERLLLISSVHDMTRVKRDQEILKESVKQLELSNKELEQFAYVASHDLQEPLRMVSSFTQLLAKKYKGKLGADADEYISYAVGGATRMQILINDLLDYSRVTRKGNPFKEISLSTVLGKAIINLKKKIDETRAVITNDELPVIHGDETQLIRLFQNLIENSLKYRSELLPHIHLGAVQVEHGWQIAVTDNGIGIDKEYKERIFEIFERLHSANKYPGTGIGLSICKKIVERHGGQIWVESNREMGVTFYFTILQKEV